MLPNETPEICRLCLVKEHVDINIFEDNTQQLFYKITSCLPVSIAAEDELPKKICFNCCDKVNLLYEFWNQTLHAQKYLLTWLNDENKFESLKNTDVKCVAPSENKENHRNSECETNGQRNEDFSNNSSPDFWCSVKDESNDCDNISFHDDNSCVVDSESNQAQSVVTEKSKTSALERLQGYTEEISNNSFSNLSRIFQVLNSPGEVVDATNLETELSSDKTEESRPSFRCDNCYQNFSCADLLAMHQLGPCDQNEGEQRGSPSHETFDDGFGSTPRHKMRHQDPVLRCKTCGISFSTKHQLQAHNATHKDTKPFVCPKCGTSFRYKKTYETHVKIHENEKSTGDEQQFVCDVCEQRFTTRNSYIHHARSHKNMSNKSKLMCVVCNRTFSTKRMLTQHLRVQCGEKKFSCETCGKELFTKESLECHKLAHSADKTLVCQVCHKTFAQRKYFIVHQRIHTGERPYKCVTCGKTFTQASALTVHRRYHTGERPYKCHVCSKGFVTRTVMLSHSKYHKDSFDQTDNIEDVPNTSTGSPKTRSRLRGKRSSTTRTNYRRKVSSVTISANQEKAQTPQETLVSASAPSTARVNKSTTFSDEDDGAYYEDDHNNDEDEEDDDDDDDKDYVVAHNKTKPKEFPCTHCSQVFQTAALRTKHEKAAHKEEVKFSCDQCSFTTCTKGCLTTHVRRRHVHNYSCDDCLMGFFTKKELTAHNVQVHDVQPFQCAMCNELFVSKSNLYTHIKNHDTSSSYVCEVCGRTYKKKNSYKRHITRSHLGLSTEAQCDICQRVLSSKDHLRRHMLTHTDERNWVCATCGKCFLSKTYLTEHSRIHLGIRPYKCEICGKCFTQRGSLTIHKRSHTGERPYRCEYCHKGFVMSTLLRYHLRKCSAAKTAASDAGSVIAMAVAAAAATAVRGGGRNRKKTGVAGGGETNGGGSGKNGGDLEGAVDVKPVTMDSNPFLCSGPIITEGASLKIDAEMFTPNFAGLNAFQPLVGRPSIAPQMRLQEPISVITSSESRTSGTNDSS